MENRYLTKTELEHMTELLKIADQCRTDVVEDFMDMIFCKIDCDVCPMHGKCETERAMEEDYENLPDDIETCDQTMLKYIFGKAS